MAIKEHACRCLLDYRHEVDNVMKEKEQVLERSNDSAKHVSGEGRWDFSTTEIYKHGKSPEIDSNCGSI